MRNWTRRADELANEYHNSNSNLSRDQIKTEWYRECGKIAAEIEARRAWRASRGAKRGSSQKLPKNPLNLSTKFSEENQ